MHALHDLECGVCAAFGLLEEGKASREIVEVEASCISSSHSLAQLRGLPPSLLPESAQSLEEAAHCFRQAQGSKNRASQDRSSLSAWPMASAARRFKASRLQGRCFVGEYHVGVSSEYLIHRTGARDSWGAPRMYASSRAARGEFCKGYIPHSKGVHGMVTWH